jgi:hypothetical protein
VRFKCKLRRYAAVFWKDTVKGEYRCTADKCPHRLVPLSEGRVNEKGEIECGYHGYGGCHPFPRVLIRTHKTQFDIDDTQYVHVTNLITPPGVTTLVGRMV